MVDTELLARTGAAMEEIVEGTVATVDRPEVEW